jgi:hypothetical protein
MSKLIRGKQIINGFSGTPGINKGEITPSHLWMTGSTTPSNGQVPTYETASGKFLWVTPNAGDVQSVSGATALQTINFGGPDVVLNVRTDGGFNAPGTIYVDSNNNITLGDPATADRLITGNKFSFSNDLIVYGNLTVNGTATTVNSETVTIADNFIELNSNFTAGTPTQNAGIEVRRGDDPNVVLRWNEVNDWWEVTNPEGTGSTYSAILTTSSVESTDAALVVTQGVGSDADKIYLSINEANLSNIPNSALTNSSITVVAGTGLGGGGTVSLGGSITLSASPVNDFYVTGGSASYGVSNVGTLTLNRQNGSVNISIEDTFVTGGTLSGSNIILGRNDGQTVTVDLSGLDVNDTYSTGGTVTTTPSNNSATGAITITGNAGFTPYVINNVNDTFTTGTSVNNTTGVITFYKNDGTTYNADLSGFDFNDTFVTGGTVSNGTLVLDRNDGNSVNITGTILQSLTAQQGLTATTSNGAVTIGIQPASVTNAMLQNNSITVVNDNVVTADTSVTLGGTLNIGLADNSVKEVKLHVTGATATNGQYLTYDAGSGGFAWNTIPAGANPTTLNKGMTILSGNTTGNDAPTGLAITTTPSNGSYPGVSVNGVWYEVGDGVSTKDCFFDSLSNCGSGAPLSIASIVGGSYLCWNGINAGFDLDTNDRIDFYYNA